MSLALMVFGRIDDGCTLFFELCNCVVFCLVLIPEQPDLKILCIMSCILSARVHLPYLVHCHSQAQH